MKRGFLSLGVIASFLFSAAVLAQDNAPQGKGSYNDLLALYEQFLDYKAPQAWNANFNDPDAPNHGLIDFSVAANAQRLERLQRMRSSLDNLNVASWDRARQVEYLAVRAQFDAEEFRLRVSKPWARDPGFYVDQFMRFAFTELPVTGAAREKFERQLAAVPEIVSAARINLDEVAADYATLAAHNLTASDGVGHGHPFRDVPPAGVIGWYNDLRARASEVQPDLIGEIDAARASVIGFHQWLQTNMENFTASAGVGKARYDWYLKHAKLLPFTSDDLTLLGEQEWDRVYAFYVLARHRNRDLAALTPATNAEEYQRRLDETDKNVRDFLRREEILTIPDYVGMFDTNVPFLNRPQGLNFWEAVQFRDPHPDHLHAVIPGHRFDGMVERNNNHPIRGRITDGVRAEGWGVYLEEAMMQAGVLENRPRVDELIYLFGVFRAARVPADVGMQRNEMTVQEAVDYMRRKTPLLDENVARVDAEIYLRRPPGYGVGYTIGNLQMRRLLADYAAQRGNDFVMKDFHDQFLATGRLPISLIRWEMTGLEDEVRDFWMSEPIPE